MARTFHSGSEIQEAVQRLVDRNREVREDAAKIGIPLPTELLEHEAGGANWTIMSVANPGTHLGAVQKAISEVMMAWDLIPSRLTDPLFKGLAEVMQPYDLVPVWSNAEHLILHHPARKAAPIAIQMPRGFWDKAAGVSSETWASACTNIGCAVQAKYSPKIDAPYGPVHEVDMRVLDEV